MCAYTNASKESKESSWNIEKYTNLLNYKTTLIAFFAFQKINFLEYFDKRPTSNFQNQSVISPPANLHSK